VNAATAHDARMHGEQAAKIRIIKENIAQLHRDGRARVRRWLLNGFDVRGQAKTKEPSVAADAPPEMRDLVLALTPESRAMLRHWTLGAYDVRGAVRARASTR
jgi:hypothetical protein